MSALSNMVRPASRQMSTRRVASATSVLPQAPNSSPLPPKVPVPKLRTGTLKPELPRKRYSIAVIPYLEEEEEVAGEPSLPSSARRSIDSAIARYPTSPGCR